MLLLVTGASGVGKSTIRPLVVAALGASLEVVELRDVAVVPAVPDLRWRQQATEAAVQRAVALQADGRHLLLCGDPVAPAEVVAAPSFDRLDGFAACLLDADPDAQTSRLTARGDPPALLPAHLGFAAWMRAHAADPRHMLRVLTDGGWDAMRWDRLPTRGAWMVEIFDTSHAAPAQVAARVADWARAAITAHT